jgi:hypothetical protein
MAEPLRQITTPPKDASNAIWTDDLLDYKRLQADPLADRVISAILEAGFPPLCSG